MYPTYRQTFVNILYTKLSWHSSFDFVYEMYTKTCRNVVYTLYTSVVYSFCVGMHYVNFWKRSSVTFILIFGFTSDNGKLQTLSHQPMKNIKTL